MKLLLLLAALASFSCGRVQSSGPSTPAAASMIAIKASDGEKVFANYFPAGRSPKEVVLAFHQAGSNAGEYDAIAPKLNSLGFDVLALNQRSGGTMWGRNNPTADTVPQEKGCESAYHDLEGALQWAKDKGYRHIIAWGSSYSAALSFRLAVQHSEVSAVIAFSPGEYLDQWGEVQRNAKAIKVPVFVAATATEMSGDAGKIYTAVNPQNFRMQFSSPDGVHGSSTLLRSRNPKGSALYWNQVNLFLGNLKQRWQR